MWWISISCPSPLQVNCSSTTTGLCSISKRHSRLTNPLFLQLRVCAICCGAFGAAGSCGEEGGPGSPHCSGKEDGQFPSGAPICQGKKKKTLSRFSNTIWCFSVFFCVLLNLLFCGCKAHSQPRRRISSDSFALSHRPSCCPPSSPAPRRSCASCPCSQWTACFTTPPHGGKRCTLCARSSPPVKETTWRCSTSTELLRKSAATRWGRAKPPGKASMRSCCRAAVWTQRRLVLQEWCRENFVNSRNMSLVKEVLAQLKDICLKVSKPSCYMRIMRITISGHHPLSSIFRIFLRGGEEESSESSWMKELHHSLALFYFFVYQSFWFFFSLSAQQKFNPFWDMMECRRALEKWWTNWSIFLLLLLLLLLSLARHWIISR